MAVLAFAQILLAAMLATLRVEAMAVPSVSSYRCQRSSGQLNDCVKQGLTRVIRQFRNGSAEFGLPRLDALEVPFLEVRHNQDNLVLELTLKNILIRGFSDIVLAKVTVNLDDANKLEVTGKTPTLQISGEYVSEGRIVSFPLHSAGSFTITMTEVTSSWVVYLGEMTRNNTSYLQVDGFDVEMMPVNLSFRPAVQLDGDNNLGEAVDVILNENSSEMYSLMKVKLATVFSGVLTELANLVLSQVPESDFLQP